MNYRKFGRCGWEISEIGYGMWGLAGWTGADMEEVERALDLSVELGCNFFDTAWAYGRGKSEQILAALLHRHPKRRLYVASKIPPQNFRWPSKRGTTLHECFPAKHIRQYTEKSLQNLRIERIDLQQFHVWEDDWATIDEWQLETEKLTQEGKVAHWGISINRWEPWNVFNTLRSGRISAVQVIYNIFDQAPEDELFPLCESLGIGVIARVPFDEGSLTGALTRETVFPADDWRATYFVPENLEASVSRAEALRPHIPPGMDMPELALRFILQHPAVGTTIPGMRSRKHVQANLAVSDGARLHSDTMAELRRHRWNRQPTNWSQ